MTFYQDLTPYVYFKRREPPDLLSLNIGWLDVTQPYVQGDTSQVFRDRLFEFCLDKYVVHIARGFQECQFCGLSSEPWFEENEFKYGENAHWMSIGDGEIRVLGSSAIYSAPALIYHYVVEHHYKPPQEFIEAVLTGPTPGSDAHMALLKQLGLGRY
jgi:hypothetical protein